MLNVDKIILTMVSWGLKLLSKFRFC